MFLRGSIRVILADETIKMTMDDVGASAQIDGAMVVVWGLKK